MGLSKRDFPPTGPAIGLTDHATAAKSTEDALRCDACGAVIEGEPAARGLFLWTRGDEVRFEEPPLCEDCAGTPVFFDDFVDEL